MEPVGPRPRAYRLREVAREGGREDQVGRAGVQEGPCGGAEGEVQGLRRGEGNVVCGDGPGGGEVGGGGDVDDGEGYEVRQGGVGRGGAEDELTFVGGVDGEFEREDG